MTLSIHPDPSILILVAVGMAAALYFSYKQLKYSHLKKWRVILMETIRLVVIAMIAFSLLKPELITVTSKRNEPEVVILADVSKSMQTQDLVLVNDDGDITVKRSEWVKTLLESRFYSPIEKRFKVTVTRFAVSLKDEGELDPLGTDINNALSQSVEQHKNLRAVILLSDGAWNSGGSPVAASAKLRADSIPVFPVATGSPKYLPDVILNKVKVPAFCLVNEKISIPFQIENRMDKQIDTVITLRSDYGSENSKKITVLPREKYQDSLLWHPKKTGVYNLTMEIPVQPGEVIKDNNAFSFSINVKRENIKVLVVDSLPRWEYRYLLNALRRDPGVTVNSILFHPEIGIGGGKGYLKQFPDKKLLSSYDVIFLGDVGVGDKELTKENLHDISGVVEYLGTGLVFLPGYRGRELSLIGTELEQLNPVIPDPEKVHGIVNDVPSHLDLTGLGRGHFLLMLADSPERNSMIWKYLPGFTWNAAVLKAAPGSEVLAVHAGVRSSSGRMPLVAIRPYGQGNVLFMGIDSAWKWRKGVEDKYHYRYWGQVVRWMAHKRHLAENSGIRCFSVPETPEVGNTVFLFASIYDRLNQPVENAEVKVEARQGKKKFSFSMIAGKGEWGVYKGSFTADASGVYDLKITCPQNSSELNMKINVGKTLKEHIGKPINLKALQEIANITGGEVYMPEKVNRILKRIESLPVNVEIKHRLPLWAQWWWAAVIIFLLSFLWILRKTFGLL